MTEEMIKEQVRDLEREIETLRIAIQARKEALELKEYISELKGKEDAASKHIDDLRAVILLKEEKIKELRELLGSRVVIAYVAILLGERESETALEYTHYRSCIVEIDNIDLRARAGNVLVMLGGIGFQCFWVGEDDSDRSGMSSIVRGKPHQMMIDSHMLPGDKRHVFYDHYVCVFYGDDAEQQAKKYEEQCWITAQDLIS